MILEDDDWKVLQHEMPTVAKVMRNELQTLSQMNQMPQKINERSEAEELSDWHKAKRFLFYEAGNLSIEKIKILIFKMKLNVKKMQQSSTSWVI